MTVSRFLQRKLPIEFTVGFFAVAALVVSAPMTAMSAVTSADRLISETPKPDGVTLAASRSRAYPPPGSRAGPPPPPPGVSGPGTQFIGRAPPRYFPSSKQAVDPSHRQSGPCGPPQDQRPQCRGRALVDTGDYEWEKVIEGVRNPKSKSKQHILKEKYGIEVTPDSRTPYRR